MESFITVCPRNCYSTCTFRVETEQNRILRILPYEKNLATPEGPCIKGLSYIERAESPQRLKHALKRNPDGSFTEIHIADALDIIAEKLLNLREKYGSHSVLWYKGSGNSGLTNEIGSLFWKLFGGATTTYGNLCWPAGLEAVRLTMGDVKHNVPWDIRNAKTVLIWGKNPAETNIQEMSFIADARATGAKVIVIDVRRTPTADKADIFYAINPGTDGALALAIAKVLIDSDHIDCEFINNNVSGYEKFKDSLSLSPNEAEKITGIPAIEIIKLAELIGAGSTVTFIPGYGIQRHANGGQTIRSILSLAIITGNLGKPGAGFNYANLQGYVFDSVKEPLSYYPDPVNDKPFRRSVSMANFGSGVLALNDPPVKMIWVERGNPLLQLPGTLLARKAFKNAEFKVVVDQFMTDTALEADIILPAKDIFEQSDIVSSYWSPYVQFKPAILKPEGDIIPETEIYYKLAKRIFNADSPDMFPEPGEENILKWLEERVNGYTNLTLKDIINGPVLAPGLQQIAWEDHKFNTPSGKIELWSDDAKSLWNISELPEYIEIKHDEFPLNLITPNTGSRIHSQFGNLEIIKKTVETPLLSISSPDASKRSICSGNRVRVYNNNGEFFTYAEITDRLPEGIISIPNGIWLSEGGGGNIVVSQGETDIGYGAAFHDARVEVENADDDE